MKKFNRDQLIFVVDCVLIGVLDRIQCGLPDQCDWQDRVLGFDGDETQARSLSWYERGGLEAAGMSLGVLYAQLTNDGLGIYDALGCAGNFDEACENLVKRSWEDDGLRIKTRIAELVKKGSYNAYTDLYDKVLPGVMPNTHNHAETFVQQLFGDYLD